MKTNFQKIHLVNIPENQYLSGYNFLNLKYYKNLCLT